MGTSNYSDELKRDTLHQISVRGHPVREVSCRSGVSNYSLYWWMKLFGDPAPKKSDVDYEVENRRRKREQTRVTEDRGYPGHHDQCEHPEDGGQYRVIGVGKEDPAQQTPGLEYRFLACQEFDIIIFRNMRCAL